MHRHDFDKTIVELEKKIEELKKLTESKAVDFSDELRKLEMKAEKMRKDIYEKLTPWQRQQVARHLQRPRTLDYITRIFEDFMPLSGDRNFKDDPAIVGGFAFLEGKPVVVLGTQKGKDTKDSIYRNFGSPNPEGYRKALRLMKLAEKFNRPVITFVDTAGAYCGMGAEERGQAEAIARNMREMSILNVPIIVIVHGEGGSGGAIGIGVGDRILMLENAVYSVISPEGCAAILWKDSSKAADAAEVLKLTAHDLLELGVIDEIVKEPSGGAHRHYDKMAAEMKVVIKKHLSELSSVEPGELLDRRYQKFRGMGKFLEISAEAAGTL
ncbi:MAG: acetyl-CoA carboxylase carboxyltransferase subunit alpha, partial [Candidatus Firestonebacteria bacterium]